jgi:DNA-binding NarL/FixJ family response regulator
MGTRAATAGHARSELIARAAKAETVGELFQVTSDRLRRMVPFDAAVWLATDPATGLPTAAVRSENLAGFGADGCQRYWELEFMVEDVNSFSGLARAKTPAASLHLATHERPARSARYRELLRPKGYADELRGVLRADGSAWALVALFRAVGAPPFDARESSLVGDLSTPLGLAVREHARSPAAPPAPADQRGPGLMVFAPDGELISVNDDALAWLDELVGDAAHSQRFSVPLPVVVVSTLMRARAIAEERERGSARGRVKSSATGRWLVCHASCLRDADGAIGDTALVIEAATAAEIAPIVAEAYELSPREQQITRLIARGLGTADIAEHAYLSTHTVRDYVKAILGKVGVSSRGELVAKLYAEHYGPVHRAD